MDMPTAGEGLHCGSPLGYEGSSVLVIITCVLGLLWAIYNFLALRNIDLEQQADSEDEALIEDMPENEKRVLIQLGYKVSDGAMEFIKQEYLACLVLVVLVFVAVWQLSEQGLPTAVAFLVGALTSMICGAFGMLIATQANNRTAYCVRFGLAPAFRTAYKASAAIGFGLTSLGLLALAVLVYIYKDYYQLKEASPDSDYYRPLCEAVVGFGLGSSAVALFGRVGAGVFTKAAEVGAELAGKIQEGLLKQAAYNPATITQLAGQNVGDVLGMGADLFGSLSECICAALVLSCTSVEGPAGCERELSNLMFPFVLMAVGIFACILVSLVGTNVAWTQTVDDLGQTIRVQLGSSAVLMLGLGYLAAYLSFPESFKVNNIYGNYYDMQQPWIPYFCAALGLAAVLLISFFTEFMTNPAWFPVQALVESCRAGAAGNISLGLALGYLSTTLPIVILAATIYFSNRMLGFYGVSLTGLGMLANLPILLAIDSFSPIAKNAAAMVRMAQLGEESIQNAKYLESAGENSAATGKISSIAAASMVALALFGGFLRNASLDSLISEEEISLTEPLIFTGLLLGAMLPFAFAGLVLRSINNAAQWVAGEITRQVRQDEGILQGNSLADFTGCVQVSARAAILQTALPALITIIFPLGLGFAFGPKVVAGFIPGIIVSGLHLAISGTNSGSAWNSANKFIESGQMTEQDGRVIVRGSGAHKASRVGSEVGEPLKDGAALSLNILLKLTGMLSLIFAEEFRQLHQ